MFEYLFNIHLVGLESVKIMLVPSAKGKGLEILLKILHMSLIYIKKSEGPRINP